MPRNFGLGRYSGKKRVSRKGGISKKRMERMKKLMTSKISVAVDGKKIIIQEKGCAEGLGHKGIKTKIHEFSVS